MQRSAPSDRPVCILGAPGSPYSRKLRAVLRYRRIPHTWVTHGSPESRGLPRPRVALLPQLFLPGAGGALEARTDSTPLIRELETLHVPRTVTPPDPALAFVDTILEDYADEWLTKAMFHYRWAFPADVAHAAAILPRWSTTTLDESAARAAGQAFAERQVARLAVVGSSETTGPVIEDSYVRLLRVLDAHLARSRFVLGARPAASDFGLFGQLTQLVAFDPTPAAIAWTHAPRVVAWVDVVEDLSGLEPEEGDWTPRTDLPDTLRALLAEVGRVYAPFLLANFAALERHADEVECTVDGRRWTQRPFRYQAKCLHELRRAHAALADRDRTTVDALLAGTGCDLLFAS
jgi:glutathione S-transferase